MENLNAEQIKYCLVQDIECGCGMYREVDVTDLKRALSLINLQEQRIAELTVELAEAKENIRRRSADYDFLSDKLREIVAEKKALADANEEYRTENMVLSGEIERLTEENERLRANNLTFAHGVEKVAANYYNLGCTDTVRKMHSEIKERCIKGAIYPAFVARTIEQIAKEMLEGV